MLQPGTSALFFMAEKVTPDQAAERLSKYGADVLARRGRPAVTGRVRR
jgi:uncharacterized membrane protein